MKIQSWYASSKRAAIAAAILAAASAACVASAQAELLKFTILHFPGHGNPATVLETFDLDSTAGMADIVPFTVYFAITDDSRGNTGAYFTAPPVNGVGTGTIQTGGVFPIDIAIFLSSTIYSGSGLTLDAEPGDTYYSRIFSPDGRLGGYEVQVAGVPELTTWAMMALGFAGLGFAGYRARHKSLTVAA